MTECKNTDWVPILSLHFEQVISVSELNFGHVAILKNACSAAVPSFPCSNIISHSCNQLLSEAIFATNSVLRLFLLFQLCASILPLGCSYVDVSWLHHIHHTKLDECSLQGPSDLPRNDTPSPMIDAVDGKIGTELRPHCQRVQVFIVL